MNINVLDSYEQMSHRASSIICNRLEANKKMLLCAATGNTPTRTYELMAAEYDRQPGLFSEMSVIKLDEWGAVPATDPGTCESYLRLHLIKPLNLNDSLYISFNSQAEDPQLECKKIQNELNLSGGIDICILGLGMNGHIALNEPSDSLETHTHLAKLSETSLGHSMVLGMNKKPSYGFTLGMADILQSKMIILLISGSSKKSIARSLLSGKLTTWLPASFLWLHSNVECLMDQDAYGETLSSQPPANPAFRRPLTR
jgi:galactosamine-6-phosphate isomerase